MSGPQGNPSEENRSNGTLGMLEDAARTAVFPLTFHFANGAQGHTNGITKRELFAAMAMQGLQAIPGTSDKRARLAVQEADALLKELAK